MKCVRGMILFVEWEKGKCDVREAGLSLHHLDSKEIYIKAGYFISKKMPWKGFRTLANKLLIWFYRFTLIVNTLNKLLRYSTFLISFVSFLIFTSWVGRSFSLIFPSPFFSFKMLLLCSPGWPRTPWPSCLSLLSSWLAGACHHSWLRGVISFSLMTYSFQRLMSCLFFFVRLLVFFLVIYSRCLL